MKRLSKKKMTKIEGGKNWGKQTHNLATAVILYVAFGSYANTADGGCDFRGDFREFRET